MEQPSDALINELIDALKNEGNFYTNLLIYNIDKGRFRVRYNDSDRYTLTELSIWFINNGFAIQNKKNFTDKCDFKLTKKGRKLLQFNDYSEYLEYKQRKKEISEIQKEFILAQHKNISLQNDTIPLQKSANESTIKSNRFLLYVFTATLVVYIGQLVVSYRTYQLQNNTIQMQLEIDQLKTKLYQNKENNALK